jgi:gas vesicle protein
MRLRLLKRRLTISAPRMAVRSALPWPFRWAVLAIVMGFCAAIGLWAFEFGKDIAGLDRGAKEEVQQLRLQVQTQQNDIEQLRQERDEAQSVSNTASALMAAEKAAQEKLQEQVKQLEQEAHTLRDDLSFFERLIPAGPADGLAIRGLQVDTKDTATVKWQVLVIQSAKNASELSMRLELSFVGTQAGKPWMMALADGPIPFKIKQYGRLEGELALPAQTQIKSVTAKVMDGSATRATQTVKL